MVLKLQNDETKNVVINSITSKNDNITDDKYKINTIIDGISHI